MHYYIIEIFLYETALHENIDPARYGTYPFGRLNMLYACLNSTKLCFDTFFSTPLSNLSDLPYTIWTLLGHAIVVLSKLSLFRTEGWDHAHLRRIIDVSECMDKLVQRFEEAKALAEAPLGSNPLPRNVPQLFMMLPSTLQRVKTAHEAMYVAQTYQTSDSPSADTAARLANDDFGVLPPNSFFDFLDEDFWQQCT